MTLFIREIETTVKSYELVETHSTSAAYVERDKRQSGVASIPSANPETKVLEDWRKANNIETAIFNRGEGVMYADED